MGRSWGIEVHDQEYDMYSPVDAGKKLREIIVVYLGTVGNYCIRA